MEADWLKTDWLEADWRQAKGIMRSEGIKLLGLFNIKFI